MCLISPLNPTCFESKIWSCGRLEMCPLYLCFVAKMLECLHYNFVRVRCVRASATILFSKRVICLNRSLLRAHSTRMGASIGADGSANRPVGSLVWSDGSTQSCLSTACYRPAGSDGSVQPVGGMGASSRGGLGGWELGAPKGMNAKLGAPIRVQWGDTQSNRMGADSPAGYTLPVE